MSVGGFSRTQTLTHGILGQHDGLSVAHGQETQSLVGGVEQASVGRTPDRLRRHLGSATVDSHMVKGVDNEDSGAGETHSQHHHKVEEHGKNLNACYLEYSSILIVIIIN